MLLCRIEIFKAQRDYSIKGIVRGRIQHSRWNSSGTSAPAVGVTASVLGTPLSSFPSREISDNTAWNADQKHGAVNLASWERVKTGKGTQCLRGESTHVRPPKEN